MSGDVEFAGTAPLRPISRVAECLGIPQERLFPYGRWFAKVDAGLLSESAGRPRGRLVLVTSMSPTPSGEGKTTLTIGLLQSLRLLGIKASACIRQPSLGPYFGAKGGATGGGLSQVLPAEEIAIHFTGDDYAVATAHNLLSSIIDNHIHHGNALRIDKERILWPRVSTLNDRALRKVRVSLGRKEGERTEEFQISAASEVMSILCLCKDLQDLKDRVGRMIVAYDLDGNPVRAASLNVTGAVAALLKNAISPNLAQTTEGAPVFIHGGPFGNISLGCNSVISTSLALKLSDYVLTEAGFSTELGAEKFFDIKCRLSGLKPSLAVVVATLRALRLHGGSSDYGKKDIEAAKRGLENLRRHMENIKTFGVPFIVVINRYRDDSPDELTEILKALEAEGVRALPADVRDEGGKGGLEAAKAILEASSKEESDFRFLYPLEADPEEKIDTIARSMYGADGVDYTVEAQEDLSRIRSLGLGGLPVCMAKTPKSLSDDPALKGTPKGFRIKVTAVRPASGAGYLVAWCGNVLLMPGLPEHPLAERMDTDGEGRIIFRE